MIVYCCQSGLRRKDVQGNTNDDDALHALEKETLTPNVKHQLKRNSFKWVRFPINFGCYRQLSTCPWGLQGTKQGRLPFPKQIICYLVKASIEDMSISCPKKTRNGVKKTSPCSQVHALKSGFFTIANLRVTLIP